MPPHRLGCALTPGGPTIGAAGEAVRVAIAPASKAFQHAGRETGADAAEPVRHFAARRMNPAGDRIGGRQGRNGSRPRARNLTSPSGDDRLEVAVRRSKRGVPCAVVIGALLQ